jgi:hypothetical protein
MSQPLNALGSSSPWIVYETDSEIEELLGRLKDCDPKEKNAQLDRGQAWRAFVKSVATIYKVCFFFLSLLHVYCSITVHSAISKYI